MKTKKELVKQKEKNLKRILAILCLMLLGTSVSAIYLLNYQKDITGEVVGSTGSFTFIQEFESFTLNVSEELVDMQTLEFDNPNGALNLTYQLETSFEGLGDGCNETGDADFVFFKNLAEINVGDEVVIENGMNGFVFNSSLISNRACEGVYSLLISLVD